MRTRVEYWEKWGGEELATMARLVRAFNESQGEYEVVLTSAGDATSSPDLEGFLAAQRAGRPPDLIGLEAHEIVGLADQEALLRLSSSLADRARALLRPEVARLGAREGAWYALPVVADLVTLYVNEGAVRGTLLEEGIPTSIASFDAALDAVARRGRIGFVPSYPGWWPEAWPLLFGGGWFDERGRFTPDREENIRAYRWAVGLRERFPLERFALGVNPIGSLSPEPFLAGEVPLVLEGDWVVRRLVREPGLTWGVAPFPTRDGSGGVLLEADLLAVPTGARCPGGASSFLCFLLDPARIEALAVGQGKVSPLSVWSSGFVAGHSNPRLADLRFVWDHSRVLSPPAYPEWLAIRARIRAAFRAMWEEGKSPEETLARLCL
jgi:ABC-type glycerol-3-phosphate transport system substrate-binding protein